MPLFKNLTDVFNELPFQQLLYKCQKSAKIRESYLNRDLTCSILGPKSLYKQFFDSKGDNEDQSNQINPNKVHYKSIKFYRSSQKFFLCSLYNFYSISCNFKRKCDISDTFTSVLCVYYQIKFLYRRPHFVIILTKLSGDCSTTEI